MSHPIKFVIKPAAIRNDGTCVIFLQYCFSAEQRTLLNTGIAVPPSHWSRKSRKIVSLPPKYGEEDMLNQRLTLLKRKAEDMLDYAAKDRNLNPIIFLQQNFRLHERWQVQHMQTTEKNLDVFTNIDNYIQCKTGAVQPATLQVIGAMKKHLKGFETFRRKAITFDCFTDDFYDDFVYYLTHHALHERTLEKKKGLKINTIGKNVKHLKAFLRNRMQKKIIPHMDLSLYKYLEEETDAIYLSWKELSKIFHLDLSEHPHLDKYRDLFILGCLTGFRFSDYSDIRPGELKNGMLHVRQTKTKAVVVVPLRPDAKRILVDKYNMQMPQVSNANFNCYIKEVARLAGLNEPVTITHRKGNEETEETRPKYEWVVSHTCRRSFCTNEFLDGTPVQLIMAISGHKTEKAFRRYIKAEQLQKAQMIQKLWEGRPML